MAGSCTVAVLPVTIDRAPAGANGRTNMRSEILSVLLMTGLTAHSPGCTQSGAPMGPGLTQAALTAEQCEFFLTDAKVQLCHHTDSAKKPFTSIRVNLEGCVAGHSSHAADYVSFNDPTCSGLGCYPVGAPTDGLVPCCEPLVADASGHCACPPEGCLGSGERRSGSPGEEVRVEGVSFTVPAGAPALWITSTGYRPPTQTANGAFVTAISPVYELGPSGTRFDPPGAPLTVSFLVGPLAAEASVVSVQDADDAEAGTNYEEVPAEDIAVVGDYLIVTVHHFSFYTVTKGNPCKALAQGDPCGTAPTVCAAAPTCEPSGPKLVCTGQYFNLGDPCSDGDACTDPDLCAADPGNGKDLPPICVPGPALTCDDGNACTDDRCDPATGCVFDDSAAGTACGSPADSVCDHADACDGSGACAPNYESDATVCRVAADTCDVTERCDGAGSCPADVLNDGFVETCYSGPADTAGVGVCQAGARTCAGGLFGACVGEVLPDDLEVCDDALDNDCNGLVDCDDAGCAGDATCFSVWAQAAAGGSSSVAIQPDGTLWAWGGNQYGQLGLGDLDNRAVPTQVGADSDWAVASAGAGIHVLAIKTDGTLWAWGFNARGGLGVGDTVDRLVPTQVGSDSDWAEVSVGNAGHSLAIKTDGTLWGWGYNQKGQVGNSSTTNRLTPVRIGTGTDWAGVAAGMWFSLGVKADGSLWAWGYNYYGQLGVGSTYNKYAPTRVGSGTAWVSVAAGGYHTVATQADGSLWAWGYNGTGQLGLGDHTTRTTPVRVGTATSWDAVSAGSMYTMATRVDGTLWGWGQNWYGQLGIGDVNVRELTAPRQVGAEVTWVSVSAGHGHTLALQEDGTLWAWGQNVVGQLGLGDDEGAAEPVLVP